MSTFLEGGRLRAYEPLIPPHLLRSEIPGTKRSRTTVLEGREEVVSVVANTDVKQRLLVIIGPSLIHDPAMAYEYCHRLMEMKKKYKDDLMIVMRSYIEKPRTTMGWKGLISDPDIDGSFEINKGLRLTRQLFVGLTDQGMPIAAEMLDPISHQFFADFLSVGAVGARTTESEMHRELASGVGFAVGFRNGTDGTLSIAIDAIRAAKEPQHFLSVSRQGLAAIVSSMGNDDCFVILRGYYDAKDIAEVNAALAKSGLRRRLMVDCSDGKSPQNHKHQLKVVADLAGQISNGDIGIMGIMIESSIEEGSQEIPAEGPADLKYGVSITDACIGWEDTESVLETLAVAVRQRREVLIGSGHAEGNQKAHLAVNIEDKDSVEGGPPQSRGGPRSHNLVWSDRETDAGTADSYSI